MERRIETDQALEFRVSGLVRGPEPEPELVVARPALGLAIDRWGFLQTRRPLRVGCRGVLRV